MYVLGFAFREGEVLLIEKKRPDWQAGFWNGIGGKLEDKEDAHRAMFRETDEETGMYVQWRQFGRMIAAERNVVHLFTGECKIDFEQKEDEQLKWWEWNKLPINVIPNLGWLVPAARLALDDKQLRFHVNEGPLSGA